MKSLLIKLQKTRLFWYSLLLYMTSLISRQINKKQRMRKHYNFEGQMNSLKVIASSSITLAQMINSYLVRMHRPYIRKAAQELRKEYQELCQHTDQQKLSAIKSALNLLVKEQVTNVDELFMGLGFQVNNFYDCKHLDLEKKVPYYLQCSHCQTFVSNYALGTKIHESKCLKNQGAEKIMVVQKKKKYKDTQEKYENRQINVPKCHSSPQFPKKLTKKQQKQLRKAEKQEAKRKKSKEQSQQIYDGAMNFNEINYFEDNDKTLKMEKMKTSNELMEVDEIHFVQGENNFFQ